MGPHLLDPRLAAVDPLVRLVQDEVGDLIEAAEDAHDVAAVVGDDGNDGWPGAIVDN